jgi:hypothetical protein
MHASPPPSSVRPVMPFRLFVCVLMFTSAVRAADPNSPEFFEAKIRPVLVEKCYGCHSADAAAKKKLRGGLALDTAAGLLAGGDGGAVVVAGMPGASPLVESLRYAGDVKMPPAGKLPDAVVADFAAWVKAGARDPRTDATPAVPKQVGPSVADGRDFWSYRPIPRPDPAATIDSVWLKGLAAKGLTPAPPADRADWLRRVTFDLTGLPPTPAETDAFVAAHSADPDGACAAVVDRLLASPGFGEHWGRHWLDVARYADSVTLRGLVFPQAWRYRDFVIDSLNADRPFDEFVKLQLAGDLLPAATPQEKATGQVAAMFLTLGNTNLEDQDKKQLRLDVIDEQLDVITKGFLAQTVTCARCHDHKFDAIPAADYYALAGILAGTKTHDNANVANWFTVPLPLPPAEAKAFAAADAEVKRLTAAVKAAKSKGGSATGPVAATAVAGVVVDDSEATRVGDWLPSTHSGTYVAAGYLHDGATGKGAKSLTFTPKTPPAGRCEVLLAYSPGNSRATNVPVTVAGADGEPVVRVNMRLNPNVEGRFVSLGEHRFEAGGQCYVVVSNEGTTGHVTADAIVFRSLDAAKGAVATGSVGTDPTVLRKLEADLKAATATAKRRPTVMAAVELGKGIDSPLYARGNVHAPGPVVPRGVLQVATLGKAPTFPANESGRRELAGWVASADNPLTARVYANRAWHWLFGAGLSPTVDNFGRTGVAPAQAELLDHLAGTFTADGWSVKRLVRRIALSRAYRQSTAAPSAADPDNTVFARCNRRRLPAEAIRDAMLAVGGTLDRSAGGPAFTATLAADYGYAQDSPRRSVYLPMFRNARPEILTTFDAADSSVVTGRRDTSTVAPQALFLMNHPFPAAQAKHAAERRTAAHESETDAMRAAVRETLGREPTPGEASALRRHLDAAPDKLAGWTAIYHALFASADFRTLN